jgi:hypothetical protein
MKIIVMNIKIGLSSFVPPNPAGLVVLAIVSQNSQIVTRLDDPKFL